MDIYLLRHGEIAMGPVWRYVGQIDLPLTPKGVQQAIWWRNHFSQIRLDRIYASDLQRARDTAEIVAQFQEAVIAYEPRFREIHLGQWDGLTRQQVQDRYPGAFDRRGQNLVHFQPPEGESFQLFQQRVVECFERIVRETDESVLIVSHAGVNRVILCHILEMPLNNLFRLDQEYGAMNLVTYDSKGFRLVRLNQVPD